MDIEFRCPECGQLLVVDSKYAGADVKCPKCDTAMLVPQPEHIIDAEYEIIQKEETTAQQQTRIIKSVSDRFSNIPKEQTISISKIKDSKCPFRYYKNYIEEPREEKPFLSIDLGLGHFFHGKAEQLFKIIASQKKEITRDDILNINDTVNEFEISFLWNGRPRDPYRIIGGYDFNYYKDRLTNVINHFNRSVIPKLRGHKVIKTEGNLQIRTNNLAIRGKYDLITQGRNDKLILWDWKTGRAPNPEYYEEFTLQKIQLGIYAIWIKHKYETDNVIANVVFLRDGADFLKEMFEYYLEEKVVSFVKSQHRALKSITNYTPVENNLCRWCSWNSKCEYG